MITFMQTIGLIVMTTAMLAIVGLIFTLLDDLIFGGFFTRKLRKAVGAE